MGTYVRNQDGTLTPAKPIEPQGLMKVEVWFRNLGMNRIANLFAWLDER